MENQVSMIEVEQATPTMLIIAIQYEDGTYDEKFVGHISEFEEYHPHLYEVWRQTGQSIEHIEPSMIDEINLPASDLGMSQASSIYE